MNILNIFFDEINSTQTWAKNNYKTFSPDDLTCITADMQTDGYGRYGRKWTSPKEMNLAITFYFQLDKNIKNFSAITSTLSLSFANLLLSLGLKPQIKWPNDVMLNEKKIAGILCETIIEKDKIHLFIGIGININMDKETADKIDKPATSLFIETDKKWDKNVILKKLQDQFLKDLKIFKEKGFKPFKNIYWEYLLYKNQKISIFDGEKSLVGKIDSINENGELLFIKENGEKLKLYSGDVLPFPIN